MNLKTLRVTIPVLLLFIAGVGYALNSGVGTASAFGWMDVSILCPLGGLASMIASKTFIPRAAISIVLFVIAVLIFGRAFCAWACPVPVVQKLRTAFSRRTVKKPVREAEEGEDPKDIPVEEIKLTAEELQALKGCCHKVDKEPIDTRHFILGGALLSTALFGFPVFCLICPIGLTFATVLLVMLLFGGGDVTWSVVAVPALLLVEVVFFRKWCSKICPISALMSLIAKANVTFRPNASAEKCLEAKGVTCGKCAASCHVGIDPRHPEKGAAMSECSKCHACVEQCPAHAITMPFLSKKEK